MSLKNPPKILHRPGIYPVRGSGGVRLNKKTKINPGLFPTSNGVYFFKNRPGKIIYLGKASDLKSRLSFYFRPQPKESKTAAMLKEAVRVEWKTTDSEIEALILESRLIKKHRPRFNVLMRDDKQYTYVVFTKETFPKVFTTHQLPKNRIENCPATRDPAKREKLSRYAESRKAGKIVSLRGIPQSGKNFYLGPFTDAGALRATLNYLRRIFPFCTCRQKHNNFCLNYHLGKCPGYCCLKKRESLLRPAIGGATGGQARIKNYELRDYGKNIRAIWTILNGRQTWLVKKLEKEMAKAAKKENFEKAIALRGKIAKIKKVLANARILRHDSVSSYHRTSTEWQKFPGVSSAPHRLEGYDIANIQGKFATGAMAVFTDSQPDQSQSRIFKIKTVKRADDLKMLKEILVRRFRHPEWPYPDLIVVDGGKAQLKAAEAAISNFSRFARSRKAGQVFSLCEIPRSGTIFLASRDPAKRDKQFSMSQFSNKIPIIALTKNNRHIGDHVFVSGRKKPIPLGGLPEEIKNLILQVDAEAHRLAIGYYRRLHRNIFKH